MAEGNGGGGNALMGVIIGVALVALFVIGFMAINGSFGGGQSADISIEAAEVPSPG